MATLSLSASGGVVSFTIGGLSNPNYLDVGISMELSTGTPIPPSGIAYSFGRTYTPPYSVSGSFFYPTGTYTFYGYGQTMDGLYWNAGSPVTVTISPTPFAWDVPKTVGSSYIGASEWNRLLNFISEKVGYFVADYATPNFPVTAVQYNQIINAVGASSSYHVAVGDAITAAKLNLLVTLANNL